MFKPNWLLMLWQATGHEPGLCRLVAKDQTEKVIDLPEASRFGSSLMNVSRALEVRMQQSYPSPVCLSAVRMSLATAPIAVSTQLSIFSIHPEF
ncbi:hypothetical protein [Skermanella aerolata]|uniref:hypothetical protein n=1 Tax=Skermanella aerolata TaxID=393310 RepID=UPI0011BE18FF|nr:hypothetical protein [Skermanella aerolata]